MKATLIVRDHYRALLRQVPIFRRDQKHYKVELPYVKVRDYVTQQQRRIDPEQPAGNTYPSLSTVLLDLS